MVARQKAYFYGQVSDHQTGAPVGLSGDGCFSMPGVSLAAVHPMSRTCIVSQLLVRASPGGFTRLLILHSGGGEAGHPWPLHMWCLVIPRCIVAVGETCSAPS